MSPKLKRREMESLGLDKIAIGYRNENDSYETISNKLRDIHSYRITPPTLGKIIKNCWGDPLEREAWTNRGNYGKKKVIENDTGYIFTGEYDFRNERGGNFLKSSRKPGAL